MRDTFGIKSGRASRKQAIHDYVFLDRWVSIVMSGQRHGRQSLVRGSRQDDVSYEMIAGHGFETREGCSGALLMPTSKLRDAPLAEPPLGRSVGVHIRVRLPTLG